MRRLFAAVIFGVAALIAVSTTVRSEEQLPLNEIDACEIVLHELIADLTRVQRNSRLEPAKSHDDGPSISSARHQATDEAFAEAIRLAQAKYSRCP
jgi:hypothetical protein